MVRHASSVVKDGSGSLNHLLIIIHNPFDDYFLHLLIIVAKGWLSGSFQEGTLTL